MEWPLQVDQLYDDLVAQVPALFRPIVKGMLRDTAEKKALQTNASHVTEADLVTALFDITPEAFKPACIKNVIAAGVDAQRYLELKKIRDRFDVSWQQFVRVFHPGNYWFCLYLTDRCNQRCVHCAVNLRRKRAELSAEQWMQIIENLESALRKRGRRGVYIWFGGEPTLRSDIRKLIEYCGKREYFHSISTNGQLFDAAFARLCAENGMQHVFVSLDSTSPEKAAAIRGAKRTFECARRAIANAIDHGLLVIANVTVMKQNIDELQDLKTMFESWGAIPYFRAVIRHEEAAMNWDQIGLSSGEYKKFYDFKYKLTIEKLRNGRYDELPVYTIYDMVPFMEQPLNDEELTAIQWGVGCQACRTISGIDINGDVFPCDYPSRLVLGNVISQSFDAIMESQTFKDIRDRKRSGKCASCHHLALCGGGCRVHAECETGDFSSSFSYCWHQNDHSHPSLAQLPA